MEMKKASKIIINLKYIAIILVALVITLGTSVFFCNSGQKWYGTIIKSIVTPPTVVYNIVWIVVLVLMAISAYMALNSNYGLQRDNCLRFFLINIALLMLWSFLFYYKNNTWTSFIDIIMLETSTYLLIKRTYLVNATAAWILMPYFCWVGIVAVLNYSIVMLN